MKINAMRYLLSAIFVGACCGPCIALAAQPPAAAPAPAAPTQKAPSAIVQPALNALAQSLEGLRPDKWKASDAIRDETNSNISSIHRDIETTLPQLLASADAAPHSVSQLLPAYQNIEALYDVLLRVVQVGNITAPPQQSAALDHARASLEDARRSLGDRLNSAAQAQDQQVHGLQAALRAVPPPPAPAVCPTPAPVKKHRAPKKTVKKAAPAPAATPSTPSTSH